MSMKKTPKNFWPIKPIVIILLFCGLALPAISRAAESGSALVGSLTEDQEVKVTGVITDASTGQPMAGVNVTVLGTTIGAISDDQGRYTISAPNRTSTLVFSFIGYNKIETPLEGKTTIDVALTAETTGLEEVVVVGYSTQKRANVVGSVASISGTSLQAVPAVNVSNSLGGRLSGVTVI